MRIGLDLDRTIIQTNVINYTLHDMGIDKTIDDIQGMEFPLMSDGFIDKVNRRFRSELYMVKHAYPIIGAMDKLKQWSEDNNIIIITARVPEIREATSKMVTDFFGDNVDVLDFVNIGENKLRQFKEYELDVWIDDNPRDAVLASCLGIKTYLIKYNYNRLYWEESGITLVDSISEIQEV